MVWRRYVWSSMCRNLAREMVEFTEAVKSIVSAHRELSMRQHASAYEAVYTHTHTRERERGVPEDAFAS
jgi:hypothetical protein